MRIISFWQLCFRVMPQTDTIVTPTRIKIDGVAAVIGDYVILDSDVDKAYIDLESQGIPTSNIEKM